MSLICDSFYVVLKSDEWKKNYPDNNSVSFRSKLLNEIDFKYDWEVALCDAQIFKPRGATISHSVWIYCDIVAESQIGSRIEPLLRRVSAINKISKLWVMVDFKNLEYVKVKQCNFDSIGIVIKEDADKHSQLLFSDQLQSEQEKIVSWKPSKSTATTLTLHFRKKK